MEKLGVSASDLPHGVNIGDRTHTGLFRVLEFGEGFPNMPEPGSSVVPVPKNLQMKLAFFETALRCNAS